LHSLLIEIAEVNKVKMILKSQNRPDVNEKEDNGN
jgi:hypothetical protein